jgi:hypothetical protein
VGSRGEEFDADALAAIAGFAEIDDAAFLLFLRFGVGEDQHFTVVNFVLEHEQAAMGVDDHGFADFLELLAVVAAARGLDAHLVKDAGAAARCLVQDFGSHREYVRMGCQEGQLARHKQVRKRQPAEGTVGQMSR